MLVKFLGFLKRTKILGLQFFKMSSKTPVKILGYFIRTMFLTHTQKKNKQTNKKPMAYFACQNLGTFKGYKDIGLTSYRNLRFSTGQNLGYFIRTMFLTSKPNGKLLLVKILGFLKSAKILGLRCIKISGLTPVEILGYFLKTSEVFDTQKKTLSIWLVEILGFFLKRTKILGVHCIKISGKTPVNILNV